MEREETKPDQQLDNAGEGIKLINLTPHMINILDFNVNKMVSIPSDGTARCSITRLPMTTVKVDGCEVRIDRTIFGQVAGIPEPKNSIFYIVSKPVADAMKAERNDLLIVDQVVRRNGKVIGCKSLAQQV